MKIGRSIKPSKSYGMIYSIKTKEFIYDLQCDVCGYFEDNAKMLSSESRIFTYDEYTWGGGTKELFHLCITCRDEFMSHEFIKKAIESNNG
jgi:hypothetical protein